VGETFVTLQSTTLLLGSLSCLASISKIGETVSTKMFGADFGYIHKNLFVAGEANESFAGKDPELLFHPIPCIFFIIAKRSGLYAFIG